MQAITAISTPGKQRPVVSLAMVVGCGDQTMAQAVSSPDGSHMQAIGLHPFPESRVILSDGRDLDPQEKQALAQSDVHHVADVRSLPDQPLLTNPLYVHFDVDIINPNDAPAMSYRAAGGPSSAELQAVFQSLSEPKRIVAVSMTTWTPQLDEDGRSQAVCMELLHILTSSESGSVR